MYRNHFVLPVAEIIQQAEAQRLNTNIVSFLPQGSEMKPPVQKPIMVERAYSVAEMVRIESLTS